MGAASAKATTALANAQSAAVSTQLAYGNDILTSANDAQTFHDKLKASAGQIGLHTQAQRDSFGAANTYIGDLSRQAGAAIGSGHGTDAAITAIRNGLPTLDSAKTKNRQYWQEVRTLVGYLQPAGADQVRSTSRHPRHRHREMVGDGDDRSRPAWRTARRTSAPLQAPRRPVRRTGAPGRPPTT